MKRFGVRAGCPVVKCVVAAGEREGLWVSLCLAGIGNSRGFRAGPAEAVGVGELELLGSFSWKRHGILTQFPVSL